MKTFALLVTLALSTRADARPQEITLGLRFGGGPPVPWIDDEPDSQRLGLTGGWGMQLADDRPYWLTVRGTYAFAGSGDWTAAVGNGVGVVFNYVQGMVETRAAANEVVKVGAGLGPLLGFWSRSFDRPGLDGAMLGLHAAGFVEVGGARAGLRLFVDGGLLHTTGADPSSPVGGSMTLARTGFEVEGGALIVIYLR